MTKQCRLCGQTIDRRTLAAGGETCFDCATIREAAQSLGARGGAARAAKLTAAQRSDVARSGAKARWAAQDWIETPTGKRLTPRAYVARVARLKDAPECEHGHFHCAAWASGPCANEVAVTYDLIDAED